MHIKKVAIIIIVIAIVLVGTNPSKEQYSDWMSNKIMNRSQSTVASFWLKPVVDSATVRTNLVFCSLYQTEIRNQSIMSLGILGNFILLTPKDI